MIFIWRGNCYKSLAGVVEPRIKKRAVAVISTVTHFIAASLRGLLNIGPAYVFCIPPVLFCLDLENWKNIYFLSIDQYGSIDPLSHWLRRYCNSWCCIEFYWGYSRRYINFFKVRQANARTTIHDHTKDKESKISNVLQILLCHVFFLRLTWKVKKKKI